jgi:hypothetical protein
VNEKNVREEEADVNVIIEKALRNKTKECKKL